MTGIVDHVSLREGPRLLLPWRRAYWWALVGRNGEVLCASEAYSTRAARDQTAVRVASQLEVPVEERRA